MDNGFLGWTLVLLGSPVLFFILAFVVAPLAVGATAAAVAAVKRGIDRLSGRRSAESVTAAVAHIEYGDIALK